jgi:hypothetical protein
MERTHASDVPTLPADEPARIRVDATDAHARAFRVALWIVAIAAVAMFAYVLDRFFFGGQFGLMLDSDAAVPAVLASDVLRTRSLLPAGWFVANGELWLLAPHLIVVPFAAVLGTSVSTLALANATGLVLAVLALAALVALVTRSVAFALIVATGAFALFSFLQLQNVYSQLAYGWFTATLAVLAVLAIVILRTSRESSDVWLWGGAAFVYAIVLLAFAAGSPPRAAAFWCLPFALATLVGPRAWPRRNRRDAIALTIIVLVIAAVTHDLLVRGHSAMPSAGTHYASPERWLADFTRLVRTISMLIGPLPGKGIAGAFAIARVLCFAAGALIVAAYAFVRSTRSPENAWLVRYVAIACVVVIGALFARGFSASMFALHYIIPNALLVLAAGMTTLWHASAAHRAIRLAVAGVFAMGLCGTGVLWTNSFAGATTTCGAEQRICALVSALEERGLTRGYASYWNANVTSVASNDTIAVGGVRLSPEMLPVRWLIDAQAFAPFRPGEHFFVAIAADDRASFNAAAFDADMGPPIEVAKVADFEIRIYGADVRNTAWLAR